MSRETWIYPADGSPPYRKGERPEPEVKGGVAILGDLPDFVSPIDHKLYSGRAGLREHCKRHDVVPNAELTGLPVLTMTSDMRSAQDKARSAAARKERIIHEVTKRYT